MNRTVIIGDGLRCDVDRLIASRLLVQANSGGGKTRTLRRLLEQTHGLVQHLVIDPEGEYHTLRERFDYVLAAPKGGDTVAHPRSAALLAERLLQMGVSAILDIYELDPEKRQRFVRLFLQALVDAPRELWHPVLVVLDEAHVYAPEGKESESTAAVRALASRGRKRGFCLVAATQRLAKLSKDVAAELNNKLVGRCTLDVDIKRAAEELGFASAEQRHRLRGLEPGQFFGMGPAFSVAEPTLLRVGAVATSHPEAGQQAAPVPPPGEKVRRILQQLADLPAEAEAREASMEDLKRENATLRRKVTELSKPSGQVNPKNEPIRQVVDRPVVSDADISRIDAQIGRLEAVVAKASEIIAKPVAEIRERLGGLTAAVRSVRQPALPMVAPRQPKVLAPAAHTPGFVGRQQNESGSAGVTRPQQSILNALAWGESMGLPTQRREKVAFLADASPKSSAFMNNLGALRSAGLIDYPQQGYVALTDAGRSSAVVDDKAPQTSAELQLAICSKLPTPQVRIIHAAVSCYPGEVSRGELAQMADASPSSSAFMNNLGALRSLGLLDYPRQGFVRAAQVLFLEGR